MMDNVIKRLSSVNTLYELLAKKDSESAKEFARVVDLLLFQEARRAGKTITIFNDTSGDYHGLDSFGEDTLRQHGAVGYQYKFFPSPLSARHRHEIETSLKRVVDSQKELRLNKWILVTPEDFVEAPSRKDGGDVTWFRSLRKKWNLRFKLEHWGHKQLLSLFLETPSLCLFYYPQLMPDGVARRRTIQDTRKRYNENLNTLYRKIDFIGMSVYKPEAAQSIPMEHIYIPLTAVAEELDDGVPEVSRINPLSFLKPGSRHVVLGDPGSGKSTMLKFLALAGQSKALQDRYQAQPDTRLPILIILRRYVDELKSRQNLSLVEYIIESVQGNFSLNSADINFFEYYLESGNAILLCDGLDELPDFQLKRDVIDRIRTLITTYPGNTVVITSRIVGYEYTFRFDRSEFVHWRLSKLLFPEVKQFIIDWYAARIENPKEQKANACDLINILQDEDYEAIRELAQNPLLLTIIAFVHRIDAMLPDQRVILYQKCTETFLNTWDKPKLRKLEIKNRCRMERLNRRRMEAIAYWMHCQGDNTQKNQRAVVSYNALKELLTNHIEQYESWEPGNDPESLAEEFLEFVKKRAGLFIEIGHNAYSFAHLTFQEYLTASHIITSNEKDGVRGIWHWLSEYWFDSRWLEVIRLLVAKLESFESQEFLIEKILSEKENDHYLIKSQLLGGLLLDGIESTKFFIHEIFEHLLYSAVKAVNLEELRSILTLLRICLSKSSSNETSITKSFKSLWGSIRSNSQKMSLLLVAAALNWPDEKILELTGDFLDQKIPETALYRTFFIEKSAPENSDVLKEKFESLWVIQKDLLLESSYGSFVAVALQAVSFALGGKISAKRAFENQLVVFYLDERYAPFYYFNLNSLCVSHYHHFRNLKWPQPLDRNRAMALARSRKRILKSDSFQDLFLSRERAIAKMRYRANVKLDFRDKEQVSRLDRALGKAKKHSRGFWQFITATPFLYRRILEILFNIFTMRPHAQWWEALRVNFLLKIPKRIDYFDESKWEQLEIAFKKNEVGDAEIYSAAFQLMFDSWLYIFGYYKSPEESIFKNLAQLTAQIDEPPLRIAHCIRDFAYGDESKTAELLAMVKSKNPKYREIFERCYWLPASFEGDIRISKRKSIFLKMPFQSSF